MGLNNNPNKVTVATAILVMFLASAALTTAQQDPIKITLNDRKDFSIKSKKGGKQYHHATIVDYEKGVDLIVHLKSLSIHGDPDLAVFLGEKEVPQKGSKPDCTSDLLGYDVCLINSKKLKNIEDVLVEVSCVTPCEYALDLIYEPKLQYSLENDKELPLIFQEEEMHEVLVKVPKQSRKEEVLILAEFKNKYMYDYGQQSEFDMYASDGTSSPSKRQQADYQSIWMNGNIRAILLPSIEECSSSSSCEISVVINAPENAHITFTAEYFNREREMTLQDSSTNGIVRKDEVVFFTISFEEFSDYESDLIFETQGRTKQFISNFLFNLVPFSGDPDLFLHYGADRPKVIEDYNWQSKESFFQDIILITADELNSLKFSSSKKFFIAVRGKEYSSFNIRVDTHSNKFVEQLELQEGQTVSGVVGKGKVINYVFRSLGNTKRKIEIVLTSVVGDPDLFVKQGDNNDYNYSGIEVEEITKYLQDPKKNQKNFIGVSMNKRGVDIVKIQYDPAQCGGGQTIGFEPIYSSCYYSIGVYGVDEKSKYMIKVQSDDPDQIIQIEEIYPTFIYMEQNQSKYFEYKPVGIDDQVTKIRFEAYFATGFASMVAGQDLEILKKFHSEHDHRTGEMSHFVEFKQEDLKKGEKLSDQTYFLRLIAQEMTQVTIRVNISRKGQKHVDYQELLQNAPLNMYIEPKSTSYFMIVAQFNSGSTVIARSDGKIKMFMGIHKLNPPTAEINSYNADKNVGSSDYVKRIDCNNSATSPEGFLYGTIVNESDQAISVQVRQQTSTVYLDLNNGIEDMILAKVKRTYTWEIFTEYKDIAIQAYVVINGYIFEESLEGGFYLNDQLVKNFQRQPGNVKSLDIDSQFIQKYCPDLVNVLNVWSPCTLTIQITTVREERLTVAIVAPSLPMYLQYQGTSVTELPTPTSFRKFVHYIFTPKELVLSLQTHGPEVVVIAKAVPAQMYNQDRAEFPGLTSSDLSKYPISSNPSAAHSLRITEDSLKKPCEHGCYLLISVFLQDDFQYTKEQLMGSLLKISVNGNNIFDIYEGDIVKGYVAQDEMIYYRVFVPSEKKNERLVINLTPLDEGDSDLFLNRGSSHLPTVAEHELKSQDPSSDFIVVEKTSFKGAPQSIEGYYMVGVYGVTNCQFRLTYSTGRHGIYKITSEDVLQGKAEPNRNQYFIFHKEVKGKFSVVANLLSGSPGDYHLFIKEFKQDKQNHKDYLSHLANLNSADLTTKNQDYSDILTFLDGSCENCVYVIGIQAVRRITFSLSVHLQGKSVQLQNNKQQKFALNKNESQKIKLLSQTNFNLYVTSLSGQCLAVKITAKYENEEKIFEQKSCKINEQSNGQEQLSFFIKHPNQSTNAGKQRALPFMIEITSPNGPEKFIVQSVAGDESRLITPSNPISQQKISQKNPRIEYEYFASQEEVQSVFVHVNIQNNSEDEDEDASNNLDFHMENSDGKIVYAQIIGSSQDVISKSFLTKMNQSYQLVLKYTGKKELEYTVTLREAKASSIHTLDGSVIDRFDLRQGRTSNYVVHAMTGQKVLVQNFNCENNQNIYIYNNATQLLTQGNQGKLLTSNGASEHETSVVKVSDISGNMYIQKRFIRKSREQESTSIISTKIFQASDPIVYDYIRVGGQGVVKSSIVTGEGFENVSVVIKDVECLDLDNCFKIPNMSVSSITYELFAATNEESLHRQQYCSFTDSKDMKLEGVKTKVEQGSSILKGLIGHQDFQIPIDKLPEDIMTLYISVTSRVTVKDKAGNSETYRFIYKQSQVTGFHLFRLMKKLNNQASSGLSGFWKVLIWLSVICLVGALGYLLWRYRQVQMRLKYELQDVRNIAHSTFESEPRTPQKEYSTIIPAKEQSMVEMN